MQLNYSQKEETKNLQLTKDLAITGLQARKEILNSVDNATELFEYVKPNNILKRIFGKAYDFFSRMGDEDPVEDSEEEFSYRMRWGSVLHTLKGTYGDMHRTENVEYIKAQIKENVTVMYNEEYQVKPGEAEYQQLFHEGETLNKEAVQNYFRDYGLRKFSQDAGNIFIYNRQLYRQNSLGGGLFKLWLYYFRDLMYECDNPTKTDFGDVVVIDGDEDVIRLARTQTDRCIDVRKCSANDDWLYYRMCANFPVDTHLNGNGTVDPISNIKFIEDTRGLIINNRPQMDIALPDTDYIFSRIISFSEEQRCMDDCIKAFRFALLCVMNVGNRMCGENIRLPFPKDKYSCIGNESCIMKQAGRLDRSQKMFTGSRAKNMVLYMSKLERELLSQTLFSCGIKSNYFGLGTQLFKRYWKGLVFECGGLSNNIDGEIEKLMFGECLNLVKSVTNLYYARHETIELSKGVAACLLSNRVISGTLSSDLDYSVFIIDSMGNNVKSGVKDTVSKYNRVLAHLMVVEDGLVDYNEDVATMVENNVIETTQLEYYNGCELYVEVLGLNCTIDRKPKKDKDEFVTINVDEEEGGEIEVPPKEQKNIVKMKRTQMSNLKQASKNYTIKVTERKLTKLKQEGLIKRDSRILMDSTWIKFMPTLEYLNHRFGENVPVSAQLVGRFSNDANAIIVYEDFGGSGDCGERVVRNYAQMMKHSAEQLERVIQEEKLIKADWWESINIMNICQKMKWSYCILSDNSKVGVMLYQYAGGQASADTFIPVNLGSRHWVRAIIKTQDGRTTGNDCQKSTRVAGYYIEVIDSTEIGKLSPSSLSKLDFS